MKTHQWLQAKVLLETLPRYSRRCYGKIVLALLLLAIFHLSGCVDVHFRVGTKPATGVLEDVLKIGQSGEAEVLASLGTPSGKGKEMFPITQDSGVAYNYRQKQRVMWSYYFEEGDLKDDRRIFLFVFFDRGRYDGYMWFSSLPDADSQASWIDSQ